MSKPTVIGMPLSTFVRTVRIALAEKGQDYDLNPVGPHSDEILEVNPFGKVPAFQHDDLTLYESIAICRYIDRTFDGAPLQPDNSRDLAIMDQWISTVCDSIYAAVIREIVLMRFDLVPMDESVVEAAVPKVENILNVLNKTLTDQDTLVSGQITLADYFLYPVLFYLRMTPEGEKLLPGAPAVAAWMERMEQRESVTGSVPELP